MVTIGLIEDSKFEYLKWKFLAENAEITCQILWFNSIDAYFQNVHKIDILVVDRCIETKTGIIDIIASGSLEKIKENFHGPIVYSSNATVFKDERAYFNKIIHNKKLISLDKLIKSLGLIPEAAH